MKGSGRQYGGEMGSWGVMGGGGGGGGGGVGESGGLVMSLFDRC